MSYPPETKFLGKCMDVISLPEQSTQTDICIHLNDNHLRKCKYRQLWKMKKHAYTHLCIWLNGIRDWTIGKLQKNSATDRALQLPTRGWCTQKHMNTTRRKNKKWIATHDRSMYICIYTWESKEQAVKIVQKYILIVQ